jgi:hypothetical protein
LVERHEILGTTLFGGYEGVDYSEGKLNARWVTQPFAAHNANLFAWKYEKGQHDWTMKRYFLTFFTNSDLMNSRNYIK